ncbi:MAG: GAF domain-containing protein [Anaerolineae bacterium]
MTLTSLVALLYLAVAIALGRVFNSFPANVAPFVLAVLFVIAIVFFGPLRDWLLDQADKRFLHSPQDFHSLLQAYSRALVELPLQTDRVLELYLDYATTAIASTSGQVFLHDDNLVAYTIRASQGSTVPAEIQVRFAPTADLVLWLAKTMKPVALHPGSAGAPTPEVAPEEIARLNMIGASVIAPLHNAQRLLGWLALGVKKTNTPYTQPELDFLETLSDQTALALEDAHNLEAANRRAALLANLNEVNQTITSTLDLDLVLHRIMSMAVEILLAEAGSLFLVDESGQQLIFSVVLGPTGDQLVGATIPMGQGIVGTVAQSGEPLIINDVHADPRWNVSFDKATRFETHHILCVPMITQDKVIGVLEVINKRDGSGFNQEECNILTSFAVQAAIAIDNARRFTSTDQALAERVQELQFLQIFDRQLNSSLNLAQVSDITLAHALDSLGVSTGVIGLMQPDNEGLLFFATRGLNRKWERYRKTSWPLDRGILGRVGRTGQTALVPEVKADPDCIPLNEQAVSQMTLPILCDEQVLGVISLERDTPEPFDEKDVEFVRRLVDHATVAVQNAYLFEQVKTANEAKTEFMSVASHELKTPMTSIKGYAKLLEMGASGGLSDQQRDFLRVIINNVNRMDRLVSDLLDVSRIEAGRIRLELGQVRLSEVIGDVVQSVETQITEKRLTVNVDVPSHLPPVWADYDRLTQVITNLVSNAYKYTPEGGRIHISASASNGSPVNNGLVVSVQDSGIGIAEEEHPQIFTKFFRSANPLARDVPGTGLGLSITKSLIEMHGGQIWFESELGQGTTFSFSLPLAPDQPPAT